MKKTDILRDLNLMTDHLETMFSISKDHGLTDAADLIDQAANKIEVAKLELEEELRRDQ